MARLATALSGLAIAVLVVGIGLALLVQPPVTRVLAARFALAEEARLARPRMLEVAEQVRAFVVDSRGETLPSSVDGRAGFDQAAVSHLEDVRRVIAAASTVTWAVALMLAVALAVALAWGRWDVVASSMRAGAWWCAGVVVAMGLAGVLDFEALFSAFHGLFFAHGTWTFPSDSLLIQTFPEAFWSTAAGLWAAVVLLGAALLGVGGRLVARRSPRQSPRE